MIDHDHYPAGYTQSWLAKVNSIAVVGASSNPARPSFGVMRYLFREGLLRHAGQSGAGGR